MWESFAVATVVVAAWGTRGDAQSAVTLAGALGTAGHEVRLAAPACMESEATRLGLAMTALGDDPLEWFRERPGRRHVDTRRVLPRLLPVFARQVAKQFETLSGLSDGADVVVAQGLSYAARSVAEAAGVPYHYLSPNVFLFPSPHQPPLSTTRATLPAWVNRISWWQFAAFYEVVFRRRVNRGRNELGLPRVSGIARHVFAADRAIAAFDPELYPPPPDVAEQLPAPPIGSFPIPGEEDAIPDRARDWLDARDGPVVAVTFGSMPDHRPAETGRALAEGARAAGVRLLVCEGWAELDAAGPHVHVCGDVPHTALFRHVDVVAHHGGVGTAATVGRAGAVHVVVPHAYDQHASAHRLQAAGVAGDALPRRRLDAESFEHAVRDALGDDARRARAEEVGRAIRARDPVAAAVGIVAGA